MLFRFSRGGGRCWCGVGRGRGGVVVAIRVQHVINISTDKAVSPVNTMGARSAPRARPSPSRGGRSYLTASRKISRGWAILWFSEPLKIVFCWINRSTHRSYRTIFENVWRHLYQYRMYTFEDTCTWWIRRQILWAPDQGVDGLGALHAVAAVCNFFGSSYEGRKEGTKHLIKVASTIGVTVVFVTVLPTAGVSVNLLTCFHRQLTWR